MLPFDIPGQLCKVEPRAMEPPRGGSVPLFHVSWVHDVTLQPHPLALKDDEPAFAPPVVELSTIEELHFSDVNVGGGILNLPPTRHPSPRARNVRHPEDVLVFVSEDYGTRHNFPHFVCQGLFQRCFRSHSSLTLSVTKY